MPPSQGSGFYCNPPGTKAFALLLGLSLTAYLYWRFMGGVAAIKHPDSCPPCVCDCGPSLLHGPGNSTADCTNMDPTMQEEISKSFIDVLTEELKLQADVADDVKKRATAALREAKKLSSQYQKEAEKCNIGMETCEDAREKAEEALLEERKISALWEKRAKDLGWKPKNDTKHASTLNP